jgi:hypothetical protein
VDKFMCHGKKERSRRRRRIIIIRNGAKTISLQTLFGRLNYLCNLLRGSKRVGVTIESYGKVEISYINVDTF